MTKIGSTGNWATWRSGMKWRWKGGLVGSLEDARSVKSVSIWGKTSVYTCFKLFWKMLTERTATVEAGSLFQYSSPPAMVTGSSVFKSPLSTKPALLIPV